MDVYSYIAGNDPNGAVRVIGSMGYEVTSNSDLARSLKELVNAVGEPAVKKIMDIHPDKEIILELYGSPRQAMGCGCSGCAKNAGQHAHYFNATGPEDTKPKEASATISSNTLAHQTNVILVVSALFIATALILKK